MVVLCSIDWLAITYWMLTVPCKFTVMRLTFTMTVAVPARTEMRISGRNMPFLMRVLV